MLDTRPAILIAFILMIIIMIISIVKKEYITLLGSFGLSLVFLSQFYCANIALKNKKKIYKGDKK